MTPTPGFDPVPFIASAYGIVGVVVGAAIVLSLLELRRWARRARELEQESKTREP